MRSKKTLKNVKVDLLITLTIVLLGFLSRKIFIDYMGADFTGLMLLFVQLIGMINIAEMGVGTATASLLYKPLSENNYAVVNKILFSTARVYKYISLLVFVIGILTGVIVYYTVPSVSEISFSQCFWLLYVINTAGSYIFAHYIILLTADQRYHTTRIIQGGTKIACIAIQLGIIIIYKSYLFYILCETVFLVFQYFLFKRKINSDYKYINKDYNRGLNDEFKNVKDKIKNVFFHKLGGVLVFNTDYIIISKFLNLTAVTVYSSYMMIFQALTMFINILGNSVTASVGNFLSQKNIDEKRLLWNGILILFFYLATCLTLITVITISDFIRLWIGNEFLLNKTTLYLLSFNLFVLISRVSLDIIKNASGEFGDIFMPILEGLINIVISIALITKVGFIGVVIGTTVSNVIIICLAKPIYLYRKVLHGSVVDFLASIIRPLILVSVSIYIVMNISDYWQYTNSFYEWFLNASILSLVIFSIVTMIFLISNEFRFVMKKIILTLIKK